MDEYSSDSASSFLRRYGLVTILGIVGIVSLVYGLIQYSGLFTPKTQEITFEKGQDSSDIPASNSAVKMIVVDVSGAVVSPQVYTLSEESRLSDLIQKAGGFATKADQEYIAKNVNQAMKLSDGMKIYIPYEGEMTASIPQVGQAAVMSAQSGLISINTATSSELDSLPGVGPVTSQKIIDNRPYASLDELVSKKAVTRGVFEKIKEKVGI